MNSCTRCQIILLLVICCFESLGQGTDIDFNRLHRIDPAMQRFIDTHKLAGISLLISKDGDVIYAQQFGVADIKSEKLPDDHSIFRIASMNKPVVSVAVMIPCEHGFINLTDPVEKYLPAFRSLSRICDNKDIRPCNNNIRIINLLIHTCRLTYRMNGNAVSSIYDSLGIHDGVVNSKVSMSRLNELASAPLKFEPDTQWEYGLPIDVLCYSISGESLDRFLKQEIFEPLKMSDTYFHVPSDKVETLVPIHSTQNGNLVRLPDDKEYEIDRFLFQPDYQYNNDNLYESGGDGLDSTIHDYHKFLLMILNNGALKWY